MKNKKNFWSLDVFIFISQLIIGLATMLYGLFLNNEMFIPIGVAIVCGGFGSLYSFNQYRKRQKNSQLEMFDERANLISQRAANVSFKITFVLLEIALIVSILPYKLPNKSLPLIVGSIMFISFFSYITARLFYEQKY